jgi:integrase
LPFGPELKADGLIASFMRDQRKYTMGKSEYVFLNQYGRPLLPDSMNQHIRKTTLKKAKLADRRMYETRHTFATLMLDAGELPGWVQRMMGHEILQMRSEQKFIKVMSVLKVAHTKKEDLVAVANPLFLLNKLN